MRLLRAAALSSAAGGSRHGTAHRALCWSGRAQGQRHRHCPGPGPSGRSAAADASRFGRPRRAGAAAGLAGALRRDRVGMESTGVYWKPVYYVLEDDFSAGCVNAAHLQHVPGRKTDVADAVWICQLLEHGLVRPSFVPPKPIRELRDLTRYRKALIQERTREVQRLQKVLEDAGIKLGTVASDVLGVSGRAMLDALVVGNPRPGGAGRAGQGSPAGQAAGAAGGVGGPLPHPSRVAAGASCWPTWTTSRRPIERAQQPDRAGGRPFRRCWPLLITIPGVSQRTAEVILAEIGTDMGQFPIGRAPGLLGGDVPGQQRVGRQAPRGHDPQGLPMAAGRADRGRQRRRPRQGHLPRQPVRQAEGTAGAQEGDRGGRALDPGDRLALVVDRAAVLGSRAPTGSCSAIPARPTATVWSASWSAWATRSPWNPPTLPDPSAR